MCLYSEIQQKRLPESFQQHAMKQEITKSFFSEATNYPHKLIPDGRLDSC